MSHHRTNLFLVEGFVDEPVDSKIDGLFKKGVSLLGDDQKDSWSLDFLDFNQKVFLSDAGRINIEDKNIEHLMGKMRLDLKTIIQNG